MTVKPMSDHLPDIDAWLKAANRELVKKVGTQYADVVREGLNRTLAYRGQSGTGAFSGAFVRSEIIQMGGIKVKVMVTVKGSRIWNYINYGTRTRVLRKTITFRLRNGLRTTPGKLDVVPFPGWAGWVTLKKGRRIRGIKPRRWHTAAHKYALKKIGRRVVFKRYALEIVHLD